MRFERTVAATNASTWLLISETDNSCGVCHPSPNGIGEGATVCQGDWSGRSHSRPSHGTCDEPLRPACASWMPIGFLERRRHAWMTRAIAASLCSL